MFKKLRSLNKDIKDVTQASSKKTQEELVKEHIEKETGAYDKIDLDDPYVEEKIKHRNKIRPMFERLRNKQDA